jgi:crotonobetaine/carnitine-CoA ligase
MLTAEGQTARSLIDSMAEIDGDRVFVTEENAAGRQRTLTYGGLRQNAIALNASLSRLGIARGGRIVLLLPNCIEFVSVWLGSMYGGRVAVPVNTASTAGELAHIVRHSRAQAIVTDARRLSVAREVGAQVAGVQLIVASGPDDAAAAEHADVLNLDSLLRRTSDADPLSQVGPLDEAQILYTSGTTSLPKGVIHTHANMAHSALRTVRDLGLTADDVLLTSLPAFHVNAQELTLLPTLALGARCVLLVEYHASRFWGQVRDHRATQTVVVAMQLRTLLAQPPHPSDTQHHLRRVFYAINVSDSEKEEFERRFDVRLVNGYGMTEAMAVATISPIDGEQRWPSIGRASSFRKIRVVDPGGVDLPSGEVGEIIIGGVPGVTLMAGYLDDPEATGNALRDGWFYTGDHGSLDRDGYLYFFDRAKDVIKRAGENVSASEVEKVLVNHPAVVEVAVIGVPDPIRDEAVKAFVVLHSGHSLSLDDVAAFCGSRLARFKIPTELEVVSELPKTSIGKVRKTELGAG